MKQPHEEVLEEVLNTFFGKPAVRKRMKPNRCRDCNKVTRYIHCPDCSKRRARERKT